MRPGKSTSWQKVAEKEIQNDIPHSVPIAAALGVLDPLFSYRGSVRFDLALRTNWDHLLCVHERE
jgi:hypothetical protein